MRPKKPKNGFFLYCEEHREEIERDHPGVGKQGGDVKETLTYANAAELVITVEDHVLQGGYGSAVLELLNRHDIHTPVIRVGWPDKFIEHATTQDELRIKYGLSVESILKRVEKLEIAHQKTLMQNFDHITEVF